MVYLYLLGEHAVRVPEVRPEVGMIHDALVPRREHVGRRPAEPLEAPVVRRPRQLLECFLGKDRRRSLV